LRWVKVGWQNAIAEGIWRFAQPVQRAASAYRGPAEPTQAALQYQAWQAKQAAQAAATLAPNTPSDVPLKEPHAG
jgi:hypothetical protein